jgi:D-threo-aldose 1-dehydrogenase
MTAPSSADWIRPLGSTGLQVSAVCVGGGPLGSVPELFGHELGSSDAVDLVGAVFDSPIRWIDTSNGYSEGESERRIGAGIARRGGLPEDFLVATKVDASGKDYSGERVRASVRESKERLGLSFLPLVYLHDPEYFTFEDMSAPGGAVETLKTLRDEGEIGHLGLAGGNVHEMSRYLDLACFEVILVHNRWTLVDRSASALLQQAQDLGVAIVNAAVYGGGILAKPPRSLREASGLNYGYRPATDETLRAIVEMNDVCHEAGTDLATAALQASVRDSRFASTIVGLSKPSRLAHIVESLERPLPQEVFDRLESLLPAQPNWLDFQSS